MEAIVPGNRAVAYFCGGEEMEDALTRWAQGCMRVLREYRRPKVNGGISFSGTVADFREYLAGWR
jgi:hypothetical protein